MSKNFFEAIKDGLIVDGGGGTPAPTLITKSVTANGEYSASDDSADGYSAVSVAVPNSYGAADEGKVVSNGALVAQTSATFTENGTYDTTGISSITIAVPVPVTAHTYGVVWDKTDPNHSTQLTYTDDAAGFSRPDPYMADGNHAGSSPFDTLMPWAGMEKVTIDGNTLVKIPKFWFKWTIDASSIKLQISDSAQYGFLVSPAHADRGDGSGERDFVYIARYKCTGADYKSQTGKAPTANITRATARTGIHDLGTTYWQQDFAMFWTVRMLYLVEFADWDSQSTIGAGGGNGSSSQNTGFSDSMPYHTGTMQSARATYGVGCQYRWIEDLFGNVAEFCDGIYFRETNIYIINNPANFSDTSGGTKTGTRPTGSNFISDWAQPAVSGYEYALYPSAVNGTSSDTYCADKCYYNSSGVVLFVGGRSSHYDSYGMFYLYGNDNESFQNSDVGSRLQYLP